MKKKYESYSDKKAKQADQKHDAAVREFLNQHRICTRCNTRRAAKKRKTCNHCFKQFVKPKQKKQ